MFSTFVISCTLIKTQTAFVALFKIPHSVCKYAVPLFSTHARSVSDGDKHSPPKRPVSAYIDYANQVRSRVQQRISGQTDVMRKIAEMWQRLPDDEKAVLKDKYRERMVEYKREYEVFLTNVPGYLIEEENKRKRRQKEVQKAKLQKQRRDDECKLNRPKHPLNPFLLFMKDNPHVSTSNTLRTDYVRDISEKWRNMSDGEKKIYILQAEHNNGEYHQELIVWEERMMEQGRNDLVRRHTLQKARRKQKANDE